MPPYYDSQNREIEDAEMDAYYTDLQEYQQHIVHLKRTVWKKMKRSSKGFNRRVHTDEVKKQRRLRQTRQW